ncbi:phosphotransferase [Paenibacillus barcinonensis]|uniref:phosphotransferase enzyme family protein n=1 Tax=Paenibacillus TaxID=44249 RepID=UPI001C104797|nr:MULTISPECIES: phosphotransferase [Paenibacillus]MBU5352071.1 phosphotransferase [Paenibacillus barcinonensis]
MEFNMKRLMNDHILSEAVSRFGIDPGDISFIGGFQNFVYEYVKKDRSYILRLSHSSHRSFSAICGELEWVKYLHDQGLSVSKAIASAQNNLAEVLHLEDSYFTISSFEKAPGQKIFYPECMNNDMLSEKCGEITGQLHQLSRTYKPSREAIKRHDWTRNSYLTAINKYIPADQARVFESAERLMRKIDALKKDDSYGLIHGDINVGNFFLDENRITLFDFDECQYSWYIEDIAIQIFYMVYVVLNDSIQERNMQARRFLKHFIKGYERYEKLSEASLQQLRLFLRLREYIVYIGMYRSFDFANLDDWTETYLTESRDRLEQGIAIVEELF